MPHAIISLNALAPAVLDRALAVAWQWALVVLVVAIPAQWFLRKQGPALRYWVWQIVLLKLFLMPLWTYAIPVAWLPAPPRLPAEDPVSPILIPEMSPRRPIEIVEPGDAPPPATLSAETAPPQPSAPPSPRLSASAWLLVGWGAVVALQIARLVAQRARLARLLREALPAGASLAREVAGAAASVGLTSPPRVLTTERNVSPFVCGLFEPRLVLPGELANSLSPDQLRQVLVHELAHLKRHDLAWGWVPELAKRLWWFHPVVHWVAYRLRLERELACDQLAMAHSGNNAADYAATLVQVVTHASQPPLGVSNIEAIPILGSKGPDRR